MKSNQGTLKEFANVELVTVAKVEARYHGYGNARFPLANSFRVRISFGNPFPGRCPGLEFANAFGVISKISLMRQVY
jgi:hypothetical protein